MNIPIVSPYRSDKAILTPDMTYHARILSDRSKSNTRSSVTGHIAKCDGCTIWLQCHTIIPTLVNHIFYIHSDQKRNSYYHLNENAP